jgi:hypothetical protein
MPPPVMRAVVAGSNGTRISLRVSAVSAELRSGDPRGHHHDRPCELAGHAFDWEDPVHRGRLPGLFRTPVPSPRAPRRDHLYAETRRRLLRRLAAGPMRHRERGSCTAARRGRLNEGEKVSRRRLAGTSCRYTRSWWASVQRHCRVRRSSTGRHGGWGGGRARSRRNSRRRVRTDRGRDGSSTRGYGPGSECPSFGWAAGATAGARTRVSG